MKIKKKLVLVLSLVTMLIISLLPTTNVQAGDCSAVLDGSTLGDTKFWNNLGEGVIVEEGKLKFPEESNQYTRFISMSQANAGDYVETVAKAEYSISFSSLPVGESFVFAFGLSSVESWIGESGNVEITFTNDNGLKVGVVAYGEDGNAVTVCEPKDVGMTFNKAVSVKAEIAKDSTMSLKVNGKDVYSGNIPVSGEGRIGFLQTKSCAAEVSNVNMLLARYERPENTNISEDFENGMDVSVLSAKAIYCYSTALINHGAGIKDYNGSKVFMMENIGWSYIGTIYDYSNFEMTFDVPYLLTTAKTDENGNLTHADTGAFIVCFGNGQTDSSKPIHDQSAEALFWEGDTVYSNFTKDVHSAKHEYWQSERGFSIQVKVVDKSLTVGMKWMDETEFETVLEYSLGSITPFGKIHIWIPERANMAIDNLEIKNLDADPNLIETEFVSGEIPYKDYEYEPFERVYKDTEASDTDKDVAKENTISAWYWLIPAAVVIGAGTLIVTAIVVNKKGGKTNEE